MHTALKQRIDMMRGKIDRCASRIELPGSSQLFVTPDDICGRLVSLASIQENHVILEPNAGTGAILRAIRTAAPAARCEAVEINAQLCLNLQNEFEGATVVCSDFLQFRANSYDRIVMNPPFNHGADIKHILHARSLLKSDGVLTAICLNGPRQNGTLQPLADHWEPLPRGTFAYTEVSTVLLRIAAG